MGSTLANGTETGVSFTGTCNVLVFRANIGAAWRAKTNPAGCHPEHRRPRFWAALARQSRKHRRLLPSFPPARFRLLASHKPAVRPFYHDESLYQRHADNHYSVVGAGTNHVRDTRETSATFAALAGQCARRCQLWGPCTTLARAHEQAPRHWPDDRREGGPVRRDHLRLHRRSGAGGELVSDPVEG